MEIKIVDMEKFTAKCISEELETTKWVEDMIETETPETVTIILNENCIIKVYSDEVMIDYAGDKVFIHEDDFGRIEIV